jgi:hypothetical protein
MEEMPNGININRNIHQKEGMYLHFADGGFLDFSKDQVRNLAEEYWNNPSKLPPHIRENDAFKTCTVCPFTGQSVFCSAMKPLLPFLEKIDRFNSYDKVIAVYVKKEGLEYVSETNMQRALQYVTNMAIFEYCEDAKQYHIYFQGIEPLMDMSEAVSLLFLNIYWLNKGDRNKVISKINDMRHAVTVTSKSCVNRLNLMCKSDAFVNAYVRTHMLAEMLHINIVDALLEKYFQGK